MTTVELDSASEDHARAILVELGEIDAALKASRGRLKAATVDSITLRGPGEIRALRAEGRRLTGRLARVFDVKPLGASWGGCISGTVGRA